MTQTNLKNNPSSSLLKETRQTKGLTLEIVHEATKIPMDALRAIEEGYSTRMLTPFYYRGFIKIYAKFLGLNVAEVLKEYNVQAPEVKISSTAKPTKPTVQPTQSITSAKPKSKSVLPIQAEPNIFLEELQRTLRKIWTPKTRMLILRVLAAVIALFMVVKFVGCVAGAIKNRPKSAPKKAAVVKEVKKPVAVVKKEQAKETAKSDWEEEEEVVIPQSNKVTLAVHASRDSWIQVKADGKVAFQMTMKKGTMENWEAKDQIELSGKNLGDLELEVNGKSISSLGTFNRRAKKVIITKEGLSVKK